MSPFDRCCCGGMICSFCVQLAFTITAIVFGALIAWKPKKVLDIQINLYRPLNWKIEPISWKKEIRNTRIMGLVVLVLGMASVVCIIVM